MSINGTSSNGGINIEDFHKVSNERLTDNEKAYLKATQLSELQTNISKEIGTNFFTRAFNYVFHHTRTVALKNISEKLNSGMPPEQAWLTDYLPQKTQELFRNYLALFTEPKIQEDFKSSLTQEEFQQIWDNKDTEPIGKGGFGTVYQSAGGKYALKIANPGKSIVDDKVKNEALRHNTEAFDDQFYYKGNVGFITEYVGTFQTDSGEDVVVFEKVNGEDFSKVNAKTPGLQCQFLAQAATAIAISHEAGCVNVDIKPNNMMVSTKGPLVLKLVDQGALVDLTQASGWNGVCTPAYAAPEGEISPAFDVFSLGVTILEKLSIGSPEMAQLSKNIKLAFNSEARGDPFNQDYSRENVSQYIALLFQREDLRLFGTPEGSKFVGLLLRDCLAYKPEDRISAAQAAEILQVFSAYLEDPSSGCPKYEEVKKMAIEDCPKGIPIALRKMLFSTDMKVQENAISAIKDLVEVDPSYKNTPSYGMFLLLKGQGFWGAIKNAFSSETFGSWAKDNKEAFEQLKERSYINGQSHFDQQDMPVSEEVYKKIHSLS